MLFVARLGRTMGKACIGPGPIAGASIGTFLVCGYLTLLLLPLIFPPTKLSGLEQAFERYAYMIYAFVVAIIATIVVAVSLSTAC